MSREDIWYTIGSLFAIYAAVYAVAGLSFPVPFDRYLSINNDRKHPDHLSPSPLYRWRNRAQMALTFIAASYLMFRASAPLTDWIPFDWGGHDEDGDWTSTREYVRTLLTFAGACWLLVAVEGASKALRQSGEG